MLHARVVRGPSEGTRLVTPDLAGVAKLPGVARVVRDGNFVAILGPRKWPLISAMHVLNRTRWERTGLPLPQGDLADAIKRMPSRDRTILDRHDAPGAMAVRQLAARYTRPYLMHGSIGPSCAVALFESDTMTVWTHSQGVYARHVHVSFLLAIARPFCAPPRSGRSFGLRPAC
jgi:nicotinate dehydrogenase subunit B